MADQIILDVILRARDQGVEGAAAAVDELNKAYDQNQKAAAGAGNAQKNFAGSMQMSEAQMSRLRYANYDLARTMLTFSTAVAAAGAATLAAFGSQEKAFTEVERILATNGESVGTLRDDLTELSTQIPMSFQDLSSIAGIGAALDIAADDLAEFASVVGRTAAVTGTSTDEVGAAIARLRQYTGVGFEQLSSAILTAGNVAIATEQEVIRFAQALAVPGAQANFTADQIIGLAAATASYANINTRGAGTAFALTLDRIGAAAENGGSKLDLLAELAGTSAAEFQKGWTDGNTSELFNKVMEGLSKDTAGLRDNMTALGISTSQQRRVISALAQNWEQVAPILERTGEAMSEGTALGNAYSFVLDDLDTKFRLFLNAVTNAAAAVGGQLAPAVIAVLEPLTSLISAFAEFASSPAGGAILQIAGTLGAVLGAATALRGGLALATAGTLAYQQATAGTMAANRGIAGQLALLASLYRRTGTAAAGAATGVGAFSTMAARGGAVGALGKGLGKIRAGIGGLVGLLGGPWVVAIGAAVAGITALVAHLKEAEAIAAEGLKNELLESGNAATTLSTALKNSGVEVDSAVGSWGEYVTALQRVKENADSVYDQSFWGGVTTWSERVSDLESSFTDLGDALATQSNNLPLLRDSFSQLVDQLGVTKDQLPLLLKALGPDFNAALDQHLDATNQATTAQNRLALIFGETDVYAKLAADGIGGATTAAMEAEAAAEQASQAYDELKQAFLGLNSTSIDAQAAQDALQGSLNGLKATAKEFSGDIRGSSDAALSFRAALRETESNARLAAVATLENGQATAKTTEEFKKARSAMIDTIAPFFESRAAAKKWVEGVFGDTELAISQIEDVGSGLDDLNSKEVESDLKVNDKPAVNTMKAAHDRLLQWDRSSGTATANVNTGNAKAQMNGLFDTLNGLDGRVATAYINVRKTVTTAFDYIGQMADGDWSSGGYTGRGGKYEPAGIVHKGEYVIPKHLVNQATGLPKADAMGRLQRGSSGPSYAQGGYVSAPAALTGSVSLTPMTIQQIARAVQHITMLDSQTLTSAVNMTNRNASLRGA